MPGEVLYRKWRPPRFADIVGQGPITQTLTQAVANDRTSHAYLLCGPRGTGKTSTARVLAKALNCTMRPPGVGDPCGACNACRAIDNGSFVDLIEIDAASNRGIDEMRDLREKVRFAPTIGRNKVYIIDEAHALTNDAFNAFLKTLEEPPPHTVFILATTEPHRLPATIVSRCQRFDFHRIVLGDIIDRLAAIAQEEGVDASPEVLRLVARNAGGSLRDATNLLDQLITSFGARLSAEQVREALGVGGEDRALALVKHLLTGNTAQALEVINAVAGEGLDLRPLHQMTVDFLRAALLLKSGVSDALELSKEAHAQLSFVAESVSLDHIMRALRLFGHVSLRFDQPSPLPLELAVVELGLAPEQAAPAAAAPQPARPAAAGPPRPVSGPSPPPVSYPGHQGRPQPAPRPAPPPPNAGGPPPVPSFDPAAPLQQRLHDQWPAILKALGRVPQRRFNIAALFRSSASHRIDGGALVVHFAHQSNQERLDDELKEPRCRLEVERVLEQALGEQLTIRVDADVKTAGKRSGESPSHLVRAAMTLYEGQVVSVAETAGPPHAAHPAPSPAEPHPAGVNGSGPAAPVASEGAPPSESAAPAPSLVAAPVASEGALPSESAAPDASLDAAPVASEGAPFAEAAVPDTPLDAAPVAPEGAPLAEVAPPAPSLDAAPAAISSVPFAESVMPDASLVAAPDTPQAAPFAAALFPAGEAPAEQWEEEPDG